MPELRLCLLPWGLQVGTGEDAPARGDGSGAVGILARDSFLVVLLGLPDLGRSEMILGGVRKSGAGAPHLVLLGIGGLELHLLGWAGQGGVGEAGGGGGLHGGAGQHPLPGAPVEHSLVKVRKLNPSNL